MDGDGDLDLNRRKLGNKLPIESSDNKLIRLYAADSMKMVMIPILECFIEENKSIPYPNRERLLDRWFLNAKQVHNYASYSKARLNELFLTIELQIPSSIRNQYNWNLIFP